MRWRWIESLNGGINWFFATRDLHIRGLRSFFDTSSRVNFRDPFFTRFFGWLRGRRGGGLVKARASDRPGTGMGSFPICLGICARKLSLGTRPERVDAGQTSSAAAKGDRRVLIGEGLRVVGGRKGLTPASYHERAIRAALNGPSLPENPCIACIVGRDAGESGDIDERVRTTTDRTQLSRSTRTHPVSYD
jgi:hypothetical protein